MKENDVIYIDSEKNISNKDNINTVQDHYEKLEKEKERLLNILDRIENQLKEKPNENIRESYLENIEEEIKEKKFIKDKKNKCKIVLFNFILLFFSSFYLIGIFIIIPIKNSLWELFKASFFCKINIFCDKEDLFKKSNYFKYFFDTRINEPIDFNLIMFWNLIGSISINHVDLGKI